MTALDLALRFVEHRFEARDLPLAGVRFAARFQLGRFLGAVGGFEDFVVEREKLTIGAGIALTATAADELTINTLCFVQLRADHVQATEFENARAEADVGTA